MRNSRKHFETVPLAEALRHAVDVSGNWSDQKASTGNMPREISSKERGVDNGIRARQPERATQVKATPRRVLVVDDERDIADMLEHF